MEEDELSLDDDAMKSIEQISMKLPSEDAKAAFRKIKEGSINEGIKQILLFAGKEICSELISKIPLGSKLAKDLFNALSDVLSKYRKKSYLLKLQRNTVEKKQFFGFAMRLLTEFKRRLRNLQTFCYHGITYITSSNTRMPTYSQAGIRVLLS